MFFREKVVIGWKIPGNFSSYGMEEKLVGGFCFIGAASELTRIEMM